MKWDQWDKTQSRELLGLFICVCIALCTTVVHNIAQDRPDNFPSYPPDNHHWSNDVYLREGGGFPSQTQTRNKVKSTNCLLLHTKLTFCVIGKVHNVWLKKTRSTKLVPYYFTFHDDTNVKARLIQNNKSRNVVHARAVHNATNQQNTVTNKRLRKLQHKNILKEIKLSKVAEIDILYWYWLISMQIVRMSHALMTWND